MTRSGWHKSSRMEASSSRWMASRKTKGNETIYMGRDALTGRVLAAEQVTSSETAVMKALLAPVVTLGGPVRGTITDAQESELQAVEHRWRKGPHRGCEFHAFGEASPPAFESH